MEGLFERLWQMGMGGGKREGWMGMRRGRGVLRFDNVRLKTRREGERWMEIEGLAAATSITVLPCKMDSYN